MRGIDLESRLKYEDPDRLDGIRMGDKPGPDRGSLVYHSALHWIEESATISRFFPRITNVYICSKS